MFNPWVGRMPWRREQLPTPVFWPGECMDIIGDGITQGQAGLSDLKYPTLCDSMDCSPPGSSVHGIFQARILEWFAISSSRAAS